MTTAGNSLVRDARRFPVGWRIWFQVLLAVNLVAPLFFLEHPEAWAVLAGYVLSAGVIVPLHRCRGWIRLLGTGHAPWLVILPWIGFRMTITEPSGAFAAWLVVVLAVDGVCLVIDAVDVARFLAGDRQPVPVHREPSASSSA